MGPSTGFIDIAIIGDDRGVQAMLKHLDTSLDPLAIAGMLGAKVGPYLRERAKARFTGEGDDVTGAWQPLAVATHGFRAAGRAQGLWSVGDANPINVRTHELENYITQGNGFAYPHTTGATLQFPKPSGKSSIREKMKTAQQGKAFPRTPPRPVIGMNDRDVLFVISTLAFHVKGTP